ncbi:MAG: methylated-DNA--[protein]-cysteine S-methyltransferase [Peptostreptococcaceae bacterium]|nr:methylated-DNA--[protein]-cysteine S-methyltransferase [Peptostreptococcaceae bacterium]
MNKAFIYKQTPVGDIVIGESEGFITYLLFSTEIKMNENIKNNYIVEETPLIKKAKQQLDEYFIGKRNIFTLPLKPKGSVFQMMVWEALRKIPYGETRSYKEIGEQIGNPKASRAVGHANNRNPISIIIPCHRVIGSNGKSTGYGGGIDIKEKLLSLEDEFANKG